MPTPNWQAARNGLPGDSNAVNHANQINQFLGTHGITPVYAGAPVVTPEGTGAGTSSPANFWAFHLDAFDYDQPFTMSGSAIGRVTIPVLPVGNGADLLVSLCADSSGSPGTVLASTRIPAAWISRFAVVSGVAGSSQSLVLTSNASPLALPQFNTTQFGTWTNQAWQGPAVVATNATGVVSGTYLLLVGGVDNSGNPLSVVNSVNYAGGSQPGLTLPQPSLPATTGYAAVATTSDTIVCAGGTVTSAGAVTANTYSASWNSTIGQIGTWTQQAALPQALNAASAAAWNETIYVVGGVPNGGGLLSTVYYGTISNGQLQSWNSGPPLPIGVQNPVVAVLGDILVVAGGFVGAPAWTNAVYYAPINTDGSLGNWQTGPSMPTAVSNLGYVATVAGDTLVIVGGSSASGSSSQIQMLSTAGSGLGAWQTQTMVIGGVNGFAAAFPTGTGQWEVLDLQIESGFHGFNTSSTLYATPRLSVPLPKTGLTNGATYHVLLQQRSGDNNDYLRIPVDFHCLPGNPTALFRQIGGSWSSYFTGYAVPIGVYDQTSGGQVVHTWEDSGAKITTLAYATTPDVRLLGIAEATQLADGSLDASVCALDYPGTWPSGAWPPLSVQQL